MNTEYYGAYGTLTITHDITDFTCACLFGTVGKKTPMFARFSTSRGTSSQSEVTETARFELKFHTERGDWDLIGNHIPVPDVRDAIEFDVFAGTRESSVAVTPDPDRSRWKFWAVSPEAAQRVLLLFADRGPPASARFMSGYGTQRFKLWNSKGRHSWVKFHLKTRQEKISFPGSGLANPPVEGPGCLARDLLAAIGSGCFPRWTLFIQVVPGDEVEHHDTSLFDPTEVWPPINRPLIEVGEVELNRNPVNYFAEVEQVAFEPLDIVPGLCLSPEAMPKEPA